MKIRALKLLLLTIGTLAITVGISVFAAIALAQTSDLNRQATSQPSSLTTTEPVEAINYTIPYVEGQTFQAMMEEASAAARRLINEEFAANSTAAATAVTILSDRNGEVVPVLMVRVSRAEWQSNPTIEQWSRYLGSYAMPLLAYEGDGQVEQSSVRPFIPISTGTREDYVLPGASLEESDPGYR
ncbi:MAG: hypothetical protein ACFBSF_02390 [Leptolyngbyaceae cyanobacterium]